MRYGPPESVNNFASYSSRSIFCPCICTYLEVLLWFHHYSIFCPHTCSQLNSPHKSVWIFLRDCAHLHVTYVWGMSGVTGCNSCAVLQAERMTQSEVAALLRTAVYIVVGIPIPAGAAAAVFFLPHSRSVQDSSRQQAWRR